MNYQLKKFQDLSLDELYGIFILRQEVFVVEQNCAYLDADGKDQASYHLMGKDEDNEILSYCRLLPSGTSYPNYTSIGRVISSAKIRGTGEGKRLLENAIAETRKLWPGISIKISAQCYLENFYASFGFVSEGQPYEEDSIPHIAMVLNERS